MPFSVSLTDGVLHLRNAGVICVGGTRLNGRVEAFIFVALSTLETCCLLFPLLPYSIQSAVPQFESSVYFSASSNVSTKHLQSEAILHPRGRSAWRFYAIF